MPCLSYHTGGLQGSALCTLCKAVYVNFSPTVLESPNYLSKVSEKETQMIIAVILWLILAVSVLGIGALMFPILKATDEALALGYAGIRLIETVFIIAASISLLAIVTLSQEYVAGALDATYYQASGAALVAFHDWVLCDGHVDLFGVGRSVS